MPAQAVAEMVREFHEAFGVPARDRPVLVTHGAAWARQRMLVSEVREVAEAIEADDLPGIAQELADCVYVLYGTALVYGIDLDAVLAAVHAANMTKLDADGKALLREDGKVLKSALYRAPDVAGVLARQEAPRA
jgi:predicted HAD superfamily Cof-like phosphohydrolase